MVWRSWGDLYVKIDSDSWITFSNILNPLYFFRLTLELGFL
uniref:Uncharacterized protein n=1 Tax=Rhizophora mucronata TaxID=61149 RepID=A0A2P2NUS5_RHIMU